MGTLRDLDKDVRLHSPSLLPYEKETSQGQMDYPKDSEIHPVGVADGEDAN